MQLVKQKKMPKRFFDTEIWRKEWYRKLSPSEKSAWAYLVAECDNVGVIKVDYEQADFLIGDKIDWESLPGKCNGNIEILPNGKWWLADFCDFQYGDLHDGCAPHRSYLSLLDRHGLRERAIARKGLGKGYLTLQEKDKDKELEKDKEKDKTPDTRIPGLIRYYCTKYEQRTTEKPTVSGQWGAQFKRWLRNHGDDDIRRVIDYFFGYEKRTLFGFGKFVTAFDSLLPGATGHQARASPYKKARCPHCGRVLDEGHAPDCPVVERGTG
jgi:hypothetical protein